MALDVERKLLRWGNGYGIRLTAAEIRRLGLAEGKPVRATVAAANPISANRRRRPRCGGWLTTATSATRIRKSSEAKPPNTPIIVSATAP